MFEPEQPTLIKRVVRSYRYDLGYPTDELCKLLVVRSGKFMKYYCDEPIPDRSASFQADSKSLTPPTRLGCPPGDL